MNKSIIIISTFLTCLMFPSSVRSENIDHLNQLLKTKQCENCDLNNVGLVMSDLSGANLRGANLVGANLSRSNLTGADLSGANLTGASFHGANLSGANLSGAIVNSSDFRNAYVEGIILENTDISTAYIQGVTGIPATAGSAEQFYLWGISEDKKGNYQKAINYYNRSIELNPDFAHAYLSRAVIKSRYGLTDTALEDAQKAEELFKQQENSDGYALSNRFIQLVKARTEAEAQEEGNTGSPQFVQIFNSVVPLLFKLFIP
ncbi:pentapeptide repeat-containing protein [Geminocystis sp. NIES-3709]|uniref:pentapeptide repeat-containing protein n=1 Tax=Geminocystis sp. NIES-3709 TaxID=1617448 RepID=UPI0005FC9225|nr:pentapeptide repeat-containing protein [Geminocystis sp. NIES-3709]BAQ63371.1 pentapeptide repeat family protein [Geminocystis sp. NIES-3709]